MLLSSTYFGPVQWYQKLNRCPRVMIEACDSYRKQTYRNRCIIAAEGGPLALTVPVADGLRVSDHGRWRHNHWQALQSAYGESPFFEFYEDDLRPLFEPRWELLYDYNEAIRQTLCTLLDIHPCVAFTTEYQPSAPDDFREVIQPKHPQADPDFVPKPYWQVYAHRHGFLPNLSVLDLLLNMGPESIFYL